MIGNQKQKRKYVVLSTKIAPEWADVLNTICDTLQVDVYHLLQWLVYTLVRAASPMHEVTPEIQRLVTMMESEEGWQKAFNLISKRKKKISQIVLILEQENSRGTGAVMVSHPFTDHATQTECVDDILERVTEVAMRGIYRRLRVLGGRMGCNNLSDVLLTMIDRQSDIYMEESNREAMCPTDDTHDNGRRYAYGKQSKAKYARTPDSVANDRRFRHAQQTVHPDHEQPRMEGTESGETGE